MNECENYVIEYSEELNNTVVHKCNSYANIKHEIFMFGHDVTLEYCFECAQSLGILNE